MTTTPRFVFTDNNLYIRAENLNNGTTAFFNKKTLFVEQDGPTGFILRNDQFLAAYAYNNVEFPNTSSIDQLMNIFASWLDPSENDSSQRDDAEQDRITVIDLKSTLGSSVLRDNIETSGDGSVSTSVGNPEYRLQVGTSSSDKALLRSVDRGKYISGSDTECNISVRFDENTPEGQVADFGYFDDENGFFFRLDAQGVSVVVKNKGQDENIIRSSDWNIDKLDGKGPSNATLDPTKGTVYQVAYRWHGYGSIAFRTLVVKSRTQFFQTVHHYTRSPSSSSQPTISNPNLPISALLRNENELTASPTSMYVIERHFVIKSRSSSSSLSIQSPVRTTTIEKLSARIDKDFGYSPVLSVRRKPARAGVPVRIDSIDFRADEDCIFQIRINAELDSAEYGDINDTPPSETVLEADTSASGSLSGGIVIHGGMVPASAAGHLRGISVAFLPKYYVLQEGYALTVAVKSHRANVTEVDCVTRFSEEW